MLVDMSGHQEPKQEANFPRARAVNLTMASLKLTVCITLVPLLTSCASMGLYNMSDDWCAKHLDASAARCPAAQQEPDRVAANTVARPE